MLLDILAVALSLLCLPLVRLIAGSTAWELPFDLAVVGACGLAIGTLFHWVSMIDEHTAPPAQPR